MLKVIGGKLSPACIFGQVEGKVEEACSAFADSRSDIYRQGTNYAVVNADFLQIEVDNV